MKISKMAVAVVAVAGVLAFPVQGSAATAASSGSIAYVSGGGGGAFERFFEARGFTFTRLSVTQAETFKFSTSTLVVIADDSLSGASCWDGWGTDAAISRIKRSHKPVLALGEGGSCFLNAAGSSLGWMNSWYSNGDSATVVGGRAALTAPTAVRIPASGSVDLYESNSDVLSVYGPVMSSDAVGVAVETADEAHYPLAIETKPYHTYFLWGFQKGTGAMTSKGKSMFHNTALNLQ